MYTVLQQPQSLSLIRSSKRNYEKQVAREIKTISKNVFTSDRQGKMQYWSHESKHMARILNFKLV